MNTRRLRAAMILRGYTGADMARALHMTQGVFSEKSNGTIRANGYAAEFTQSEIAKIKRILSLSDADIISIFFNSQSS